MTQRWTPPTGPVPPGWSSQQPPPVPPPGSPWGGEGQWGPQAPPKPGVIPLRPLGVGEILDGAVSSIRAQPMIMLGLSAVVAVATQVLTVPLTWLLLRDVGDAAFSLDETVSAEAELSLTASALSAAALQLVVTLVAVLLLTGFLTVVVSRAVLGERLPAGPAWERTRPRVPALFGVTGLVLLIEVGVLVAAMAPGTVLALASAPTVAVVAAFVLGGLVALAVGVYLYVAFALAPATVVLERQRVVGSLRRSRQLVSGAWWRTFGILLLVHVIAQVLSGILAVPFTVGSLATAWVTGDDSLNPYTILPLLVSSLGTIAASAIVWPFTAVATALVYVDRRMRREALDLELARAAGVPRVADPRG